MFFVAFLQPFQSSQFIIAGGLRGAGDTKATAIITTITVLLIRPIVALILIHLNFGLYGAWLALACDQLTRSALVLTRYKSGKWKMIKLKNEGQKKKVPVSATSTFLISKLIYLSIAGCFPGKFIFLAISCNLPTCSSLSTCAPPSIFAR